MTDWDIFSDKDIDLLIKVISLYPDLDMVAYAGKLGRDTLQYPLESHDDLLPLFGKDKGAVLEFRGHEVSFEQVLKYLPDTFFPIENEDQFLSRTLIAFAIQQNESMGAQNSIFIDPGLVAMMGAQGSMSK